MIYENLRQWRKSNKIQLKKLAVQLKMSEGAIIGWEKHGRMPNEHAMDLLQEVANKYDSVDIRGLFPKRKKRKCRYELGVRDGRLLGEISCLEDILREWEEDIDQEIYSELIDKLEELKKNT